MTISRVEQPWDEVAVNARTRAAAAPMGRRAPCARFTCGTGGDSLSTMELSAHDRGLGA
ncbi:MAG: hypothetical protein ACLSGS_05780 [Adlercreutzia sp.]